MSPIALVDLIPVQLGKATGCEASRYDHLLTWARSCLAEDAWVTLEVLQAGMTLERSVRSYAVEGTLATLEGLEDGRSPGLLVPTTKALLAHRTPKAMADQMMF